VSISAITKAASSVMVSNSSGHYADASEMTKTRPPRLSVHRPGRRKGVADS
jgi:integrase